MTKILGRWTVPYRPVLLLLCGGALAWLALTAWLAPTSLSLGAWPLALCFAAAAGRIVYELTFNRFNVPTITTAASAQRKIAALLAQEAAALDKKPFTVVDLGAGRGSLARLIAKKIPRAQVIGIEYARGPFGIAAALQRLFGPANLSFERRDFWTFACAEADAVVLYLSPLALSRMGEKLRKELKPGALVLSYAFALPAPWQATERHSFRSAFAEDLYVYKAPDQSL